MKVMKKQRQKEESEKKILVLSLDKILDQLVLETPTLSPYLGFFLDSVLSV